jgi:formate dehydrogenase maturation protein FdhE
LIEAANKRSVAEMFEQRGARAALLASQADPAREPLQFAAALCKAQARLASALETHTFTGRLADDVDTMTPLHRPLIQLVAERADAAQQRLQDDPSTARSRLLVYWSGDLNDYLSRSLLQPYAEVLRARNITPDRLHHRGHCGFCGGAAWISARKSAPDAESGFRYLGCSLCGLEWNFNRICCPSCFEEDPPKLPNFQSDSHSNVRIEACETCRRYVKSIDLTQDARPIPIIDDLLSLSLDLWAMEEGYQRIEPGLAGI